MVERLQQQQQQPCDPGLTVNLLGALGALAEGSLDGAQAVVAAGGVEAVLAQASAASEQQLQLQQTEALREVAADVLCKLAGQGEELRAALAERVSWAQACSCSCC